MTLCPVAIVVGCKKCAIVEVCPLKGIIGDYQKSESGAPPSAEETKPSAKQGE